ncbi:MAG: thiamine-phosphate synthase family protein [Thermoplasmatota archaeon]
MLLPDEIVSERVAPTLRALLARALIERGLSQTQTAHKLGVTQSAVSKSTKREVRLEPTIVRDPRVTATIARLSGDLASDRLSPLEGLAELMSLVRVLETRGPICALHEKAMPSIAGLGCDLCIRLAGSPVRKEQDVLENVRAAVRILASSPEFASYLPSVGSNVAMALPSAKERSQVAAVPGGLFEFKGSVKAPAPPEFGVSKHVANVVLAVMQAGLPFAGCVNLAARPEVRGRAARSPGGVLEISAEDERDARSLGERIRAGIGRRRRAAPRVLWQGGAFGVEPTAYVLGADALDAARHAVALVEGGMHAAERDGPGRASGTQRRSRR